MIMITLFDENSPWLQFLEQAIMTEILFVTLWRNFFWLQYDKNVWLHYDKNVWLHSDTKIFVTLWQKIFYIMTKKYFWRENFITNKIFFLSEMA